MKALRAILIMTLMLSFIACQQVPKVKRRPYMTPTQRGVIMGAAGGAVIGASTLIGTPVGAVIGGVTGSVIGNNIEANQVAIVTLRDKLAHCGVEVFSIGEDVRMVLPDETLFFYDAPRINLDGKYTLQLVAEFLDLYKKELIKVEAFTNTSKDEERNFALTRAQAESVVDYLTRHTKDSRLIIAEGHGASRPLTAFKNRASAVNRRVEISFRAIPIPLST